MQLKWREGERAYYIVNGKIFNSFVRRVCDDGLVMLSDGRVRRVGELFKARALAREYLAGQ